MILELRLITVGCYTVRSISCGWRVATLDVKKCFSYSKRTGIILRVGLTHTLIIGILSSKLINRRFEGYFYIEHMCAYYVARARVFEAFCYSRGQYPYPINGQYIHNALEVA